MKKNKNLKLATIDCLILYFFPIMFYVIQIITSQILLSYSTNILGEFSNYVLYGGNEKFYFKEIACIVGASIVIPLVFSTLGEIFLFKKSLLHEQMLLKRYLSKKMDVISNIHEYEIQNRLENDQVELGIKWCIVGSRIIACIIVIPYLMYQTIIIVRIFAIAIVCVSSLKVFFPLIAKNTISTYDKKERDEKTKIRNQEKELLEKTLDFILLGIQKDRITEIKSLMFNFRKNVFEKKVKYITFIKQMISNMDAICICILLIISTYAISINKMQVGIIPIMIGYYYIFNTQMNYVVEIIQEMPICGNLLRRIEIFYTDSETSGKDKIEDEIQVIKCRNLSYSYGEKNIIKNFDIDIKKAEKICITGENGTGKSTILKILGGLYTNYSGDIFINEKRLKDLKLVEWRERCAYVEQVPFLFNTSVKENIHIGNKNVSIREVDNLIEELGITYLSEKIIDTNNLNLSGGEFQKIALARALLKRSDILIMDEPTNNLDYETKEWIKKMISNYNKTLMFVSHDKNIVNVADKIIVV